MKRGFLEMVDPRNHRFQDIFFVVFWMIWGCFHFRKPILYIYICHGSSSNQYVFFRNGYGRQTVVEHLGKWAYNGGTMGM